MGNNVTYRKRNESYIVKKRRKRLNIKRAFLLIGLPAFLFLLLGLKMLTLFFGSRVSFYATYEETYRTPDVKVNYIDNEFYDKHSDKNYNTYVASLVKDIDIDFKYEFHSADVISNNCNYNITSTLFITDKNDKTKVLYKDSDVKSFDEVSRTNNSNVITESFNVDFKKYATYVADYRKNLAVSSQAYLEVVFHMVNTFGHEESTDSNVSTKDIKVSIPLSEHTFSITSDKANKVTHNLLLNNLSTSKPIYLVVSVVFFISSITLFVTLVMLWESDHNNDLYEKALRKILKEYDAYIVHSKNSFYEDPDLLIRVENFNDLLDAQKIEDKPIVFYEVEKGNKSYFVINGTKNIYRFTLTRKYQEEVSKGSSL